MGEVYPAATSGGQVRWEDTPNRHACCDAETGRLRSRAETAEAKLAEIREMARTYFVVHGNSNAASLVHARDLAEGIRQILDRKAAS